MVMSVSLASAEVIKLKCRNKRGDGIDDSSLSFWVDTKKNTVTNDRKIAVKATITKESISWINGDFRNTVNRENGDMEVLSISRNMSIEYTCIKVLDKPAF